MYTTQDYLYGWVIYLAGYAVFMICWWLLTAKVSWRPVRRLLRVAVAVAFIVPWYSAPDADYLAPAWVIAATEGAFDGGDAFWRAGMPLLAVLSAALLVAIVLQVVWAFKQPLRSASRKSVAQED